MNICIYYPDYLTKVGDAYDVHMIAKHLNKPGDSIFIICRANNKISGSDNIFEYRSLFEAVLYLYKNRNKFDIIHLFCGLIPELGLISFLLRRLGVKYAYSPFGQLMPEALRKGRLKKYPYTYFALRPLLKKASLVHVISTYEYTILSKLGATNILTKPFGLSGYEVEANNRLPNNLQPNIVYIGRLDIWQKGLDNLVGAVNIIRNDLTKRGIKVILCGRGDKKEIQQLNKLISHFNLSHLIEIRLNISENEKSYLLSSSMYFIHPSRVEGFARSTREALNAGIPLITTYQSNIGDIVQNYNAGFVSEQGVNNLSNCINSAIEVKMDFKRNKKMFIDITWANLAKDLRSRYGA